MQTKTMLASALALALVACGGASEPTGQVVATVGGEEITTTDLNAELAGATAPNAEQQKLLQRRALESIINRTILAQAAEEEGLTKGPEAAVIERKAKQMAMVELLNRHISSTLPKVSDDETAAFIADNPAMFRNRQIFVVDQVIVPTASEDLVKALQPLTTMADVKALLAERKIASSEAVGVIDTLQMPPPAAAQISALPPGEVFIIPSSNGLRINVVRSSQANPIDPAQQQAIAREMVSRQRAQAAMSGALRQRIEAGRKDVQYNKEFAPPPAPAGAGAPPAGTAPTGAPAAAKGG